MKPFDPQDERGIGMVYAIGIAAILFSLSATAFSLAVRSAASSSAHDKFETALHLAEQGIDQSLARIQKNESYATLGSDSLAGLTPSEEFDEIVRLAEDPALSYCTGVPSGTPCIEKTAGGEFAVLKPPGRDVIYAVGWTPARDVRQSRRIVKVEYLLSSYRAEYAILAGGDLDISGNANVGTGLNGAVHANGDLEISGSPSITGSATSSGEYDSHGNAFGTADSGGGRPSADVPDVDPRQIYEQYSGDASITWYDLCVDASGAGVVKTPSAAPCGGTAVGDGSALGWNYVSGKWKMNSSTPANAVYYVYRASVELTGNAGSTTQPWHSTVITEGSPSSVTLPCAQQLNGDIEVAGNIVGQGLLQQLVYVAGRDLKVRGTPAQEFEGLLAAHEQIEITANPTLVGAAVAEDACDSAGSPVSVTSISGNMSLSYDGTLDVPLGALIRTRLWNEPRPGL